MSDHGSPPLLEVADGVATITLNRPRHLNRLEPADLQVLCEHVAAVDADARVRLLVLRARVRAHRPVFSAGFDLSAFEHHPQGPGGAVDAFARAADALAGARPLTLAVLNGSVYGGAVDCALACDFRLGIEGMEARVPAAALGLHYYASGLQRAVATLGWPLARRLFLAAEALDTPALRAGGFLDACVPADALEDAVQRWCTQLLALAPLAVQSMKRTLADIALGRPQPDVWRAREQASHAGAEFAAGRQAALMRR
ncbi:MAG: enoyl-CoA hydratase/isomerase family protein [Pseudomonadota bacterium]